jgi:hypothetical protein
MKRRNNKVHSSLAKVRFFSPAGFMVCALVIAIAFAGLEALGLRSSVATLAGTNPMAVGWPVLGPACLYLLCYLAFVGLVPILILGSIFLLLLNLIIATFRKPSRHLRELA